MEYKIDADLATALAQTNGQRKNEENGKKTMKIDKKQKSNNKNIDTNLRPCKPNKALFINV